MSQSRKHPKIFSKAKKYAFEAIRHWGRAVHSIPKQKTPPVSYFWG